MRAISDHVQGSFALLAEPAAARITPDHDDQPGGLGFTCQFAQLLVLQTPLRGAGIDRIADAYAAQPQRIGDRSCLRTQRILFLVQQIVAVQFENQWNFAREVSRASF